MTKLPAPSLTPIEIAALEYGRQFVKDIREETILAAVLGVSPLDPRAGRRLGETAMKQFAVVHGWRGMLLVIDLARAGVVDAQNALDDITNDYLHASQPLPPSLADYVMRGKPAGKPARSKTTNILTDAAMAALVEQLIERFHLNPNRNESRRGQLYKLSACAVVWIVFTEAGLHRGSETAVQKVWRRLGPLLLAAPKLTP